MHNAIYSSAIVACTAIHFGDAMTQRTSYQPGVGCEITWDDEYEWGSDAAWEALDATSPSAATLDAIAVYLKESGQASA